jgi:hypothetical protein
MDQHGGAQGPPDHLVAELDGGVHEGGARVGGQRRLGAQAAERLHREAEVVEASGVDPSHQRPGGRTVTRVAELQGVGVLGQEGLPAAGRSRVVGRPGGHGRQHLGERAEKRLPLAPSGMGDEHPGGLAVEAGVVDEHGRHVLGLEDELGPAPAPGHDHHRRDVARLAGDRLAQDPPEHVAGLVRPGDVDLVDLRVVGQ